MRFDSTDSGWKITGPLVRLPKGMDENPCYGREMTIVSYGTSEDSKAVLRIATSKGRAEMPSAIMAMSGPGPGRSGIVPVMPAPEPTKVRCDPQPKSTEFGPDGELICTCYAWEGTDCNNEENLDVICMTCTGLAIIVFIVKLDVVITVEAG